LPDIPLTSFLILLSTALIGGTANALAGGGTFLVFPALMLIGRVDSIVANATSTGTMFPGGVASAWVYRKGSTYDKQLVWGLVLASAIGGAIGSILVLMTPSARFARIVPYLMLSAALIFSLSEKIAKAASRHISGRIQWTPLIIGHFLISVYGGYFGAGMGVLMIVLFALVANQDVQQSAALRFYCSLAINAPAVVIFAARHVIVWNLAIPMALASIVGGYWGAKLVRKLSPRAARNAVLVFAWAISIWLLVR
jgi:hypothetical protein